MILDLIQIATPGTDEDIGWMSPVLCQHVTWKEIEQRAAFLAGHGLNPNEVLNMSLWRPTHNACRPVHSADPFVQIGLEPPCGSGVCIRIEIVHLLFDDPIGHGVDVPADHLASHAVRLYERGASAHKGVKDPGAGEILVLEELISQISCNKLGEEKAAKERARPSGEPFVDGDDGPVVLLNLFLVQGQISDKRNIEGLLDQRLLHMPVTEDCT
jgi:hypothetical protein